MLSNQDLFKALTQNRREIVDVRLGAVPVQPTAKRGGQYQVVVEGTPKENSAQRLAKSLNQFPQIIGQYKNLQEKAGIKEVQEKDRDELEQMLNERVEKGDEEAKIFSFDYFKRRAMSQELYRQSHTQFTEPALKAVENHLSQLNLNGINQLYTDETTGAPLTQEQVTQKIVEMYDGAIPEKVKKMAESDDHQAAIHNGVLRQIPSLAARSQAMILERRTKYLDDIEITDLTFGGGDFLGSGGFTEQTLPPNVEVKDAVPIEPSAFAQQQAEWNPPTQATGPFDEDGNYRPELLDEEGNLIEDPLMVPPPVQLPATKINGITSTKGVKTASKNQVYTLQDYFNKVEGADYITAEGAPEFVGQTYIADFIRYVDKNGKEHDLYNVPVLIDSTDDSLKEEPEGAFNLYLGSGLSKEQQQLNTDYAQSIKFTKEPASSPPSGPKVVKTASQVVNQQKAAFEMQVASAVSNANASYNNLLEKQRQSRTSQLQEGQTFRAINDRMYREVLALIQNEEFEKAGDFIEQAVSGTIKLGGRPYDPVKLATLQTTLDRKQDEVEEEAEKERYKEGEKTAKELMRGAAKLIPVARTLSPLQLSDNLTGLRSSLSQLYSEDVIDGETFTKGLTRLKEVEDLAYRSLSTTSGQLYDSTEFHGDITGAYNGAALVESTKSGEALLAVAAKNNIDMEPFIKMEGFGTSTKPKYNEALSGIEIRASRSALQRTNADIAAVLQEQGMIEPTLFDLETPEGKININDYYEQRYRVHYEKAALEALNNSRSLIEQIKRDAELTLPKEQTLQEAAQQSGTSQVELLQQRVQSIEGAFGDEDLLDERGRLKTKDSNWIFDESNQEYLTRFNNTFKDPASRQVISETNKMLEIQRAVNKANLILQSNSTLLPKAKELKELQFQGNREYEENTLFNNLRNTLSVTGLPMSIHRNDGVWQQTVTEKSAGATQTFNPFLSGFSVPSKSDVTYTLDFAQGTGSNATANYYSSPRNAATVIYSSEAVINASYGNTADLEFLWEQYFEDAGNLPKSKFIELQLELGRKYKFIETPSNESK